MTAADTWTRRLFLMDGVPAQLDLLPCSAAMPADLGPTSIARWLVIPFSHDRRRFLGWLPHCSLQRNQFSHDRYLPNPYFSSPKQIRNGNSRIHSLYPPSLAARK